MYKGLSQVYCIKPKGRTHWYIQRVYNVVLGFCRTLLYVHSSVAIILMGKRELVALLNLSSWCLVMVDRLFLAVPWGCLLYVIVVLRIILTYYFYLICCLFFFAEGGGASREWSEVYQLEAIKIK